jgi:hypothetical protein
MARREQGIEIPQPSRQIPGNVQDENAVLGRHCFIKTVECHRGDTKDGRWLLGLNGRATWQRIDNAHLAEEFLGSQSRKLNLARLAEVLAMTNILLLFSPS